MKLGELLRPIYNAHHDYRRANDGLICATIEVTPSGSIVVRTAGERGYGLTAYDARAVAALLVAAADEAERRERAPQPGGGS